MNVADDDVAWTADSQDLWPVRKNHNEPIIMVQWNLSVTTTSIIRFITCDLFSNVF